MAAPSVPAHAAMPFDCDHRRTLGPDVCPAACHAVDRGAFAYRRADKK